MIGNRFTHAAGLSIVTLSVLTLLAISRDALAQSGEIIVDQLDPNTSATGSWKSSSGRGPYAGSYFYTRNSYGTFSWYPEVSAPGSYHVYARWTYHPHRSERVPYRIEHDGGITTIDVNQQDETLADRWQLLGTYEFTPGVNGKILVSSENGDASADAVRLVPIRQDTDGGSVDSSGDGLTDGSGSGSADGSGDGSVDGSGDSSGDWLNTGDANNAPTISGTPQTTVLTGMAYLFVPDASDADGDVLTFDIANKPGWAEFDPATGALSGRPGSADVGTYNWIGIVVTDGQDTAGLTPFSLEVQAPPTRSVTLNWQPPTENTDGSALTDLDGYYISYGTDPGAMSHRLDIPNEGLTSFVVENLSPAVWYFELFAVNEHGISSDASNTLTADLR